MPDAIPNPKVTKPRVVTGCSFAFLMTIGTICLFLELKWAFNLLARLIFNSSVCHFMILFYSFFWKMCWSFLVIDFMNKTFFI